MSITNESKPQPTVELERQRGDTQPSTKVKSNKNRKIIGGLAALAAAGGAAYFALAGGSSANERVEAVPAATTTPPSAESTTTRPPRAGEYVPSTYLSEFEPVFPYSQEPEQVLEQLRLNIYRAGFAETDELRDQYIFFLIGSNYNMYEPLRAFALDIYDARNASGLTPEDYLEQTSKRYEYQNHTMLGDDISTIDYITTRLDDPSYRASGHFQLYMEPANADNPERLVIGG